MTHRIVCLAISGFWWWWVVAHVILVSALGQNTFSFFETSIQLGVLLGQGLGLRPGLDNKSRKSIVDSKIKVYRQEKVCGGNW